MDNQKPLIKSIINPEMQKIIDKVFEKNKLNKKLQESIYNSFIYDKIKVKEKGWRSLDEI